MQHKRLLARVAAGALIVLGATLSGRRPLAAQSTRADSAAQLCFAADTARRWKEVAMAWAVTPEDHGSDPALRQRLLDLARRDQALRNVPGLADSANSDSFNRRLARADSANAAELMALVRQHGWPTRKLVGVQAASAAFLVAQHNAHIQQEALRRMSALPPSEVSPSDLAMLRDRVLVRQGNPQIFGTQLKQPEPGKPLEFVPILDLPHLEARRAEAGLPPMDTYMCLLRNMYGREVQPPPTPPQPVSPAPPERG